MLLLPYFRNSLIRK
ncbi:hypothetical protein CP061683_0717, partial [Chlamydia psittaci 06-1683]